jgi:MFS family permease
MTPYPPRAIQPSVKATLAASYLFAVAMLGVTLPTPLYPLYEQALGFSTLVTTVIYAAYSAGVMITLILFGGSSDHYGRRPVLLAGLACSAASAICFAARIGLPEIFAGRILSGLSAGFFTGTATAYVIDLAPRARRGRATLLAAAANMGGVGAGALLAGLTAQYLPAPLRTAYAADLALVAIGVVLLVRLPETAPSLDRRLDLRPCLGIPRPARVMFARAAIAGGAGYAVNGYFLAVIPSTLQTQFIEHNHAVTGAVICLLFGASLVGQLAVPALGDERALGAGCLVLIAGMGLLAASLTESSLALLTAGAIIAGAGQGLSFRGGLALVRALSPQQQAGRVASTFFVVLYAAVSTAVIGVGIAAQNFGLRQTGIATAVIVAVLAAICAGSLVALRE